jgi:hypothetical protein
VQRPFEFLVTSEMVYKPGLLKLNSGASDVALVPFIYVNPDALGVQPDVLL